MKRILAIISIIALGASFNSHASRLRVLQVRNAARVAAPLTNREFFKCLELVGKELERRELQDMRNAYAVLNGAISGVAAGLGGTAIGIIGGELLIKASKEYKKNGSEYRAMTLDNNANHSHFQTLSPF